MSACRRSFPFVFVFLTLNNGHVASLTVGPGMTVEPVLTECYLSSATPSPQLLNSLLTVASANGVLPELLPVVQKVFPETQRLIFNDLTSQPFFKESASVTLGSYPQDVSINTVATSNCAVPNQNGVLFTTTATSVLDVPSNSVQISESISEVSTMPSQLDYLTVIDQPYPTAIQTVQVDGFSSMPYMTEVYQTPITVQVPSMPTLPPFYAIAKPFPAILQSQNVFQENCAPKIFTEIYPQSVNEILVPSVPIETTVLDSSCNDFGCGGQQFPLSLQINMASPWIPEPVIAVISPPSVPESPTQFDFSSFGIPPYPIIVMENSKSKWKTILPILLVALLDGGFRNNGGGCCCSQCTTTPIPYPIVIPTNNPITSSSSKTKSCKKEKGKAPSKAGKQD